MDSPETPNRQGRVLIDALSTQSPPPGRTQRRRPRSGSMISSWRSRGCPWRRWRPTRSTRPRRSRTGVTSGLPFQRGVAPVLETQAEVRPTRAKSGISSLADYRPTSIEIHPSLDDFGPAFADIVPTPVDMVANLSRVRRLDRGATLAAVCLNSAEVGLDATKFERRRPKLSQC